MKHLSRLLIIFGLMASVKGKAAEYARAAIPADGQLLYASFDREARSDIGAGYPIMQRARRYNVWIKRPFSFTDENGGVRGRALDMQADSMQGASACFKSAGHVCLRCGTLSVWYRATNSAPALRITRQSCNYVWSALLFAIQLPDSSGTGVVHVAERNFAVSQLPFDKPKNPVDGQWHHLAFIWDETRGVRLVHDGAEVFSNWGTGAFQMGYAGLGNLAMAHGQFDELRVFDWPLADRELEALRQDGRTPRRGTLPPADSAHRIRALGWDGAGCFIPVGAPTLIRILAPSDARELRNWGWRAMDGVEDSAWPRTYKAYKYLNGGGLHIRFAAPESFDYARVAGAMPAAKLAAGDAWQCPSNASEILRLPGSNFIATLRASNSASVSAASVYPEEAPGRYIQDNRELHEIAFLKVAALGDQKEPAVFETFLQAAPVTNLAGDNLVRLLAWYRPEERRIIAGRPRQAAPWHKRILDKIGSAALDIPAWSAVHLVMPAQDRDLPLGAVRLRLAGDGWKPGTKINLRLHDPNNLWRALADVDVEVQEPGPLEVKLEFAPTILPAGTELMLALVGSENGRILCDGRNSSLSISGPELPEALSSYRTWQHRLLRDYFQVVSEPRPWGHQNSTNESWLRVASPSYDAIARIVGDLNRRFPDDRLTRGYMLFTHPKDSGYWTSLPAMLPEDPAAPRWAVLQKESLRLFMEFADWWTDERQTPNGEFGSRYSDDTDLVQDWPGIAMVCDPGGKYKRSVRMLADYTWNNCMSNGLNIAMTDVLHAYEEGINAQADAAMMDYGNPILFERLQATARRYDGFLMTPAENGRRKFRGSIFNYKTVSTNQHGNSHYGHMMLHSGLILMWYNGNPALTRLMTEFYDGNPENYPTNRAVWPRDLPRALFARTGDRRFVIGGATDPWTARMLNIRECSSNVLAGLANPTAEFTVGRTDDLNDSRPLDRYTAWHYTRDKNLLAPALEYVYKATYYTLPLFTETQQSADRVAVKKKLSDFMYLGGIPAARFNYAPFFAVSYENLSPDFAALVLDDTPELLRWVGFNFEPKPQSGLLRVWNLAPGTYAVRQGIDEDGDDRIDGNARIETMELKRHEPIPVTLPSRKLWIVEAECRSRGTPLHQRCDLAICAEDAVLAGSNLTVTAHNLGRLATGPFRVEVADAGGKLLASRHDPNGLEGAADLSDRRRIFSFAGNFSPPLRVSVSGAAEEITECNNAAVLNQ